MNTSIKCPQCGMVSYHPQDILNQYCGNCHQFHAYMRKPILRCTWCCKDVDSGPPCPICGNHSVSDRTKTHSPEWSRKNMHSVECKVCDRVITNEVYFRGNFEKRCNPVVPADIPKAFSKALRDAGYQEGGE